MPTLSVKIEGSIAQYIRDMSQNNGVSAKDYTLYLLVKAIGDEKKEAQNASTKQHNTKEVNNVATTDRWNRWGLQWLDTLEDMKNNIDPEDATTRLTQFELNLMEQLRAMVVKPEDETPPPEPTPETKALIAQYRQRAQDFFIDHLDENEWDIDSTPMVALSDHGAYVQLWKWFSNEDDE